MAEQAEKLTDQIAKLDEKEKDNKDVLKKYDLRADTLKTIAKETEKDTKKLKSATIPVSNIFGSEEYVKVKKSDWDKIIDAFSRAVSRNKLLEKYEKKIVALEKKVSDVNGLLDKMRQFISIRGLDEAFVEFVKSLEPKTMKERLTDNKNLCIHRNMAHRENIISVPNCNSWKERLFMNITYEKNGDYLIPNLISDPEPEGELRKFGLMRKRYLKEHRSGIYQAMLLSGKLKEHLKEENQMLWVQRMNNIRERAEEIVRATLLQ